MGIQHSGYIRKKEKAKWVALVRSLKYSGGTTFNLRLDKHSLPAGYTVIGSCIEQVTYFDIEDGYRLNVRERGFGNLISYTAIDITRTDWPYIFADTKRQALGRKADLSRVQLLPHVEDLLVQMMGISRSVLFAQAA